MDLIDSASHHIRIPGDIPENLFGLALRILYLLQLLPAVRLGSRRCDIGIRAEQKYRQNLDHAGTHITETESAGCRSKNHNQKVLYHNPDIDLEGIRLVIVYGNHNNHRKYIQKQHVVCRRKQNDRVHHSESLRHQVLDRRAFLVPAPEKSSIRGGPIASTTTSREYSSPLLPTRSCAINVIVIIDASTRWQIIAVRLQRAISDNVLFVHLSFLRTP